MNNMKGKNRGSNRETKFDWVEEGTGSAKRVNEYGVMLYG
jgi:hypothetical protein